MGAKKAIQVKFHVTLGLLSLNRDFLITRRRRRQTQKAILRNFLLLLMVELLLVQPSPSQSDELLHMTTFTFLLVAIEHLQTKHRARKSNSK